MDTTSGIPSWWLILTGIFFFFNLISTIITIVVLVKIGQVVIPLIKSIQSKVDSIGTKVEEIASKVQQTTAMVQSRTQAMVGTAETGSAEVTRKVGLASAGLTGLFTVLKVIKFLRKAL